MESNEEVLVHFVGVANLIPLILLFDPDIEEMVRVVDRDGTELNLSLLDLFSPGAGRVIRTRRNLSQEARRATSGGRLTAVQEDPQSESAKDKTSKEVGEAKGAVKDKKTAEAIKVEIEDKTSSKPWTEDNDNVLWQMKEDDRAWSDIALATGNSEAEAKKRWVYLLAKRAEAGKAKGKGKAVDKDTAADLAAEVASMLSFVDDASDVDPDVEGNKASAHDVIDDELAPPDSGEINVEGRDAVLLTRLHDYYESGKWLAIASRFFDKTGRRIPPEVLKHQLENDDS